MIQTYTLRLPKMARREKLERWLNIVMLVYALELFVILILLEWKQVFFMTFPISVLALFRFTYLMSLREDPMPYFAANLLFDTDKIVIGNIAYEVKKMENLHIKIYDYDGLVYPGRPREIRNGTNNRLSFTYNKQKYLVAFYIISKEQREQFKPLLEAWYLNKIPFTENGGRSYLLEGLRYKEIQAFKKKYGLDKPENKRY